MIRTISLIFIILVVATLQGQEKPILVFDLVNGTLDSITNITYNDTITSDRTTYSLGNYNSNIETLEQTPPVSNVFPNSQFTLKKRAAIDFDLTNYPIRTSVITLTEVDGERGPNCSGSMISNKHVLTAAHCISSLHTNTVKFDSIYVCPVFDNGNFSAEFNCSYVRKAYIFRDWTVNHEDFAVLELNQAIGAKTGWISIGFNANDSMLAAGIFYKFSYPKASVSQVDSNEYNGDTLYYNYGRVDIVQDDLFGINNVTGIPGESGSSLIKVENGQVYTTYGVATFAHNFLHNKLTNWEFYSIKHIIQDDLVLNIPEDIAEPGNFQIYPNPTNGILYVKKIAKNDPLELTLFDLLGREIWIKNNHDPSSGIDISPLSRGIYYLGIKTNGSIETKRIIKSGS